MAAAGGGGATDRDIGGHRHQDDLELVEREDNEAEEIDPGTLYRPGPSNIAMALRAAAMRAERGEEEVAVEDLRSQFAAEGGVPPMPPPPDRASDAGAATTSSNHRATADEPEDGAPRQAGAPKDDEPVAREPARPRRDRRLLIPPPPAPPESARPTVAASWLPLPRARELTFDHNFSSTFATV